MAASIQKLSFGNRTAFQPGDKIVETASDSGYVMAQAYVSPSGERKLLLVNKRDREFEIDLPGGAEAKIQVIDQRTGSNPPASAPIAGSSSKLGGFGVAVVTLAK